MPYAINGQVSTDPIEGAVEISDEQYREAVDGMCSGLIVSIDGGFSVALPPVPEPPPVVPPTAEELRAAALAQRDSLMAVATARMAPLQDAADIGNSTDAEAKTLIAWKHYRVDLNRIEQQATFPAAVDWPVAPA